MEGEMTGDVVVRADWDVDVVLRDWAGTRRRQDRTTVTQVVRRFGRGARRQDDRGKAAGR